MVKQQQQAQPPWAASGSRPRPPAAGSSSSTLPAASSHPARPRSQPKAAAAAAARLPHLRTNGSSTSEAAHAGSWGSWVASGFSVRYLVIALVVVECIRLGSLQSHLGQRSGGRLSAAVRALNADPKANPAALGLGNRLRRALGGDKETSALAVARSIVFKAGEAKGLRDLQRLLLRRPAKRGRRHHSQQAAGAVADPLQARIQMGRLEQQQQEQQAQQQWKEKGAYLEDVAAEQRAKEQDVLKNRAYLDDLHAGDVRQQQPDDKDFGGVTSSNVDYDDEDSVEVNYGDDGTDAEEDPGSKQQVAEGAKGATGREKETADAEETDYDTEDYDEEYGGDEAGGDSAAAIERPGSKEPEFEEVQAAVRTSGAGRESDSGAAADTSQAGATEEKRRWLSFNVCNGLTNQRIAILSAVLLAAESRRTLLLPRLLVNGTQSSNEVNEKNAPSCAFEDIMSPQAFKASLAAKGVVVEMPNFSTPAVTARVNLTKGATLKLLKEVEQEEHVWLTCPLLQVPPSLFLKHEPLVWAALEGMQPADDLREAADALDAKFKALSPRQAFNVLHLRLERDWQKHCPNLGDKFACLNNTVTVGAQLRQLKIDAELPLLLVLDRENLDNDMYQAALANMRPLGYRPFVLKELAGSGFTREQAAMLSYQLGLRAHQFVGNAVSTFSALLIMERAHSGKFAAYYNGGMIPLKQFVPLYQLSNTASARQHALDNALSEA
ncbi:hypothetical protein N2152v2_002948 [Parachlorella kessleri]